MLIKQETGQNSEPPLNINVILYRERLLRNITIPEPDIQFIKKNRPNLLSEQELELTKIYLDDEHQESIRYYPRVLAKTPDQLMKEEERVGKLEIHGSYIKDPHQAFRRNPHLAFIPDQEIINFVTEVEKEGISNGVEMIGNDSRSIDQPPKIYGEAINRLNHYQTVAIPGSDNFFIHPGVILCKCPEVALLRTEQINSVIQSFFDNGFKHPYRILGEVPILLVRGMLRVNTLISQFPKDQRQSVIDYLERHSEIFDLPSDEAKKILKENFSISTKTSEMPKLPIYFMPVVPRQESSKSLGTQSPAQLPESRKAINPNTDHNKGTNPPYWWLSTKRASVESQSSTTSEISITDGTIEKHRGRPKGSRNRDKSPKIIDHVSLSKPNPTTSSDFSLFAPKVIINGVRVSTVSQPEKPALESSEHSKPIVKPNFDSPVPKGDNITKTDHRIKSTPGKVLTAYQKLTEENNGLFPSINQLEQRTGLKKAAIYRYLHIFETQKLIIRNKKANSETGLTFRQQNFLTIYQEETKKNNGIPPSTKRMAEILKIGKNTVEHYYRPLRAKGLIAELLNSQEMIFNILKQNSGNPLSIDQLEQQSGYGKPTIYRCLRYLETKGILAYQIIEPNL